MTGCKTTGALIGCGTISKNHLECMRKNGYRIGALCDVDAQRAETQKVEYGDEKTQVFTDYTEMLKDPAIDVVAILTPPHLHTQQIIDSLQAGKFVYCEKPVVKTLDEFDAIFSAEESSGKRAYFTPGRMRGAQTPMIKQYLDDGDAGDVYRVDAKHIRTRGRPGVDTLQDSRWFADSRKALAGIMGDMGLYMMDRTLYLTGWPRIESVSATAFKEFPPDVPDDVVYDVEEHVVMFVRTEGKLTFTFEFANIAHHDQITSLMMLGTKGGIHVGDRKSGIRFLTEKGGPWRTVEHKSDWTEKEPADVGIYEELGRAVQGGAVRGATTSREALVLHQLLAAAYQSASKRREVRLDELDPSAPIFMSSW